MKVFGERGRAPQYLLIGLLIVSPCDVTSESQDGQDSDTGERELLPKSRCLWLQQPGPVPGLLTHREEKVNLMGPVTELLSEVFLLMEDNIEEHEVEGYIWAGDPGNCVKYGDPISWTEYSHDLGGKFKVDDKLIMSSLISNRGGNTVCVSDHLVNTGEFCQKGFNDMKEEENITFVGTINSNSIMGAYLQNKGKIGYLFDMYQSETNNSSKFVCKQTGISRAYLGLLATLKSAIREYIKLTSSLEFDKKDEIVEDCPNLLSTAILKAKGKWDFGDIINSTQTEEISSICDDIWNNHLKRSIFSYLFQDNFHTLQGIMSSTNLNIKNLRILDTNLRGYVNWNNKIIQETRLIEKQMGEELKDVKKTLTLLINFNILEKFETNRHNERIQKFELLFSIFNRAEALVIEGRRLLEKILRGLSEDSMCALDNQGKISCQQDAGLLSLKDHTITITTKARKIEIKSVSQANCLFLDNGKIFKGQNDIFVWDGDFFHSPKLSVPVKCAVEMKDEKYSCKQYFEEPTGEEGKGWPDQFSKNVFYVLTSKGVFVQNLGNPAKIVFKNGDKSIILTSEPTWIRKADFPIQLAGGKKFSFESLVTVSSEINLNFKIIHHDRQTHFDYSKYRELHKSSLKAISFEKLYGSFTQLFKNNFAVRIISVTGVLCASILMMVLICFIIYCCSHSKAGNRRYLRYSRRTGGAVITEEPRPPPSAPEETVAELGKDHRRRGRESTPESRRLDRLQRLLRRL